MNDVTAVVLIDSRHAELANRVLDSFVPIREAQAEEFEYPQYSESADVVFSSPEPLMRRLEDSQLPYYLAWRGANEVLAFVIFTEGVNMIIGVGTSPSESAEL